MSKRIVVISDTQIPYHDRRAVKGVLRFIGDTQPDEVVHIGDLMDFPQQSRWSKGGREEYEGSIYKDCEKAKRDFLGPLREVYGGPVGVIEGNHDRRPRDYLMKYAPALAGKREFDFDVLLDFDGFGVDVLPEHYSFAPGWLMMHGHRGGAARPNQLAGNTAMLTAKRLLKSVIMGHTHRCGQLSHTYGYGGKTTREVTGIEVGHLMDVSSAGYMKGATPNWQKGFGFVVVEGNRVYAEAVRIVGNTFRVEGTTHAI